MEHNFIEVDNALGSQQLVIYHRDYNLDAIDNLESLPKLPAVYLLGGRVNNQPANARYVGGTNNLRDAIIKHFSNLEKDDCLRGFMRSIKIKTLVYQVMADATPDEIDTHVENWRIKYSPKCNDELNKVY